MIGGAGKALARAEAARLTAHFVAAGAVPVETAILQPAGILLDLYGEDIRARAYVTSDPLRGELMLRPDFTVPVVQMHMAARAEPARYTYAGEVFRRQEADENRPNEYLQVGFEVFDGARPVAADAEVLATVMAALDGLPLRVATGDIGILTAAVRGLTTTEARKAALLRHIWRPRRFLSLIDRFAGRTPVPPGRAALLAARDRGEDPLAGRTVIGQRGAEEIAARIEALAADAAAPPIPAEEVALIGELLALSGPAPEAARALAALADRMPALAGAAATFAARLEALAARGIDPEALGFEASFGRNAMEYYDGFVFGLFAPGRDDLPPVATGGRYDALTAVLGQGRAVPAVGAVIRPEVVLALRGAA